MGNRSLKGILLRFALIEASLLVIASLVVLAVMVVFSWAGIIGSAQDLSVETDVLAQEVATADFRPQEIPQHFAYRVWNKSGEEVASNKILSETEITKARNSPGGRLQVSRNFISAREFRYLEGRDYDLLISYPISGYFTNDLLERLFPSLDIVMILLFLVSFVLLSLLNLRRGVGRIQRELDKIEVLNQHIQKRDLAFVPERSEIKEIDRLIENMATMKTDLAASLQEQWAKEQAFTSNIQAITHDIRTPITIIKGNLELLAEEVGEDEEASVAAALKGAERIDDYVAELRTLSALTEAKPQKRVPITEAILDHWRKTAQVLVDEKGLELIVPKLEASDIQVVVSEIERALENILVNGVQYTPIGEKIWFSGYNTTTGYILEIQDSGPGFSAAALKHGSERFFTEDTARSGGQHYGLGLTIAQQMVAKNDGRLELANGAQGAVVRIVFSRK